VCADNKRQFGAQERSELLNDPMPLQISLPFDSIAIEPNDMHGVARHLADHLANVSGGLDIERLAIPIDLARKFHHRSTCHREPAVQHFSF
jgi:hypothetical protein